MNELEGAAATLDNAIDTLTMMATRHPSLREDFAIMRAVARAV